MQGVAGVVLAEASDEGGVGPCPPTRHCLIETLAPWVFCKLGAEDSFAWCRKALNGRDQIKV